MKRGEEGGNLGIEHDGGENLSVVHSNPEIVESLLMVLVSAMGEVEARDVHASPEKLFEHGNSTRRGT